MPFTKINPKWNFDQNVRFKTLIFSEYDTGENLELGFGDDFLDITSKTWNFLKSIY